MLCCVLCVVDTKWFCSSSYGFGKASYAFPHFNGSCSNEPLALQIEGLCEQTNVYWTNINREMSKKNIPRPSKYHKFYTPMISGEKDVTPKSM